MMVFPPIWLVYCLMYCVLYLVIEISVVDDGVPSNMAMYCLMYSVLYLVIWCSRDQPC